MCPGGSTWTISNKTHVERPTLPWLCNDEVRMLARERKMFYFEEIKQGKIKMKQRDRKDQ